MLNGQVKVKDEVLVGQSVFDGVSLCGESVASV